MVKHIAIGAEVLGSVPGPVKSDTVVNGSPLLQRFCVTQTLSHGDGPLVTRYCVKPQGYNEDLIYFFN